MKARQKISKILTVFLMASSIAMPVFASTPGAVVISILKFVFDLVAYVLVFFGAYKMAWGFGGNKPEEQTKGVQMAISGVMILAVTAVSTLVTPSAVTINVYTGLSDMRTWINRIAGWIAGLGAALVTYGLIKFALAFQNDDTNGRTKAYQQVITGAILAMIGPVVNAVFADSVTLPTISISSIGIDTLLNGAFTFVGGSMVLFGSINLAQAFSKEDADAKAVGTRWMVAGTLIMSIGTAATTILFH